MSGFYVRCRSIELALSRERSGIRVGSDGNCDMLFTMVRASASQPAGLVICGE